MLKCLHVYVHVGVHVCILYTCLFLQTTSGGDPDHRVDYSDDFECSASQVSLQSSPSTPLSTPPDSPRTSETEAHGKQNLDEVVPPAVTPLLTPLESSDEVRTVAVRCMR